MTDIQIPGKGVFPDGSDLATPTEKLLQGLNLLGTDTDDANASGFASVFRGPPQSVAVIEAGLTAGTKWWSAGGAALVLGIWGTWVGWWKDQTPDIKVTVLWGAAIVTAALVVAVGYLLASDVRGRGQAAVATIRARERVAESMIRAAQAAYKAAPSATAVQIIPLASEIDVKNLNRPGADEEGWRAVAIQRESDGELKYIVVKGSTQATVPVSGLDFLPPDHRLRVDVHQQ